MSALSGRVRQRRSPGSARLDPTREPVGLALTRRLAAGLTRTVLAVRVTGLEHLPPTGPVLLAGNHSGWLDGPLVHILLPRPSIFLVKSEMYDTGFRRTLDFARQIPIRRGTPDRTALQAALAVLDSGGVLGVFPEGTRGSGSLENIQHGIGYLALHGSVPIIPVVCLGTSAALPKGRVLPRWRAPVEIALGPAFELHAEGDLRTRAAIATAADDIRTHLLDHLAAVTARDAAEAASRAH